MLDARHETFETLGTNRSDTRQYREEFGEVLRREKLHDENGGPDKMTRSQLLKIMEREAEVVAWWENLPPRDKARWNHPDSIWRHFEGAHKTPQTIKPQKSSPVTGLTADEEAEEVRSAQVLALQKRDEKIASLRDTERELRAEIQRLNAEIVELRKVIGAFLKGWGYEVSDLPTAEDIRRVMNPTEAVSKAFADMTTTLNESFGRFLKK
jgi:hypothetical protein